ncbi:MAG: hypothetical protein H0X51_08795 [Parachlamydiaceae bacterium]|nr:hypothetical protein [Parachlamydiaceae bacterium]
MNTAITYGENSAYSYLKFVETVGKKMESSECGAVSEYVNGAFFRLPMESKPFSELASLTIPTPPFKMLLNGINGKIEIGQKTYLRGVVGFAEGIPVIGTAIAIINGLAHWYQMVKERSALEKAIKTFNASPKNNDYAVDITLRFTSANAVFYHAIAHTVHANQLFGSVLGLVPFVKPIARLAQGILFNYKVGTFSCCSKRGRRNAVEG